MRQILIHNQSQPAVSPVDAVYCETFLCQLKGLTFRRSLSYENGLLLVQRHDSRINSAIHMMFVLIDLSVVWVNSAYNVVDVRLARRWRPVYVPVKPARYILEVAAERINDFRIGDLLDFRELPDG